MAKVVFQHRDFLNLAGYGMDGSVVATSISYDTEDQYLRGSYPTVTFLIKGCDRTYVELDFGLNEDDLENGLHKIEALMTALKKFRKAYLKEAPRYKKANAKWRAEREKKNAAI